VIGACSRCRRDLALSTGRPRVAAGGKVELFCATCWDRRDEPVAVTAPIEVIAAPVALAPAPRRAVRRIALAAAALALGAAGVVLATRQTPQAAALPASVPASSDSIEDEAITEELQGPVTDDPPPPAPEPGGEDATQPPAAEAAAEAALEVDGEALDERFPTLKDWTHPVTDSPELTPVRSTRKFGAKRAGIDRTECGGGHCGVDLAGPRGRPVVAVAWGTVVRVEHSEHGRDGKSGRYVRIEHPDGVFTSYMHLDAIAPGLAVGDEVDAGRVVGTLGKSAIQSSEEHLHFALEVTIHGQSRFIDPAPFLSTATVTPIPARAAGAVPRAERPVW
jgi:murein DD-endopeptidase MepM/ murein hydrolase activator NlpD